MVKTRKEDINNEDRDFNIWVLLDHSAYAVFRAREMELNQFGLTHMQAAILFSLQNEGGKATLAQLSNWLLREPNSVSALINRMVKNGLVDKIRGPEDEKIRVVITDKGRTMYEKTSRRSISMILTSLSDKEKEQFITCLKKVRTTARNLLGVDYRPPFLP